MLNINIVYHCILQVPSIYHNVSCVATAPSSFLCCEARLATSILSFMCLPIMCMTNIVTSNKIIAVTNRKTLKIKLSKKESLLGNYNSILVCLSGKPKFSFFYCNWSTKSFNVFGAISNLE